MDFIKNITNASASTITQSIYWGSAMYYLWSTMREPKGTPLKNDSPTVAYLKQKRKELGYPESLDNIKFYSGDVPFSGNNHIYLPMNDELIIAYCLNPDTIKDTAKAQSTRKAIENFKREQNESIENFAKKSNVDADSSKIIATQLFGKGSPDDMIPTICHEYGHIYHNHYHQFWLAPFVTWTCSEIGAQVLDTHIFGGKMQDYPLTTLGVKLACAATGAIAHRWFAEYQADGEVIKRIKNSTLLEKDAHLWRALHKLSDQQIKHYPSLIKPAAKILSNWQHPSDLSRAQRMEKAANNQKIYSQQLQQQSFQNIKNVLDR